MNGKKAYAFCKFLQVETKKIDEDKWYEGLRRNNDPGQDFIIDWINRNAKNWRDEWENSKCQHCKHWKICGHEVRRECKDFIFDELEESEDD